MSSLLLHLYMKDLQELIVWFKIYRDETATYEKFQSFDSYKNLPNGGNI